MCAIDYPQGEAFRPLRGPATMYQIHIAIGQEPRWEFMRERLLRFGDALAIVLRDHLDGKVYRLLFAMAPGSGRWLLKAVTSWSAGTAV